MDHLNAYDSLFAVNDNDVLLVLMKPVLDLFADFQEKLEWRWSLIFNSEKPNSIFKDFWGVRSLRFFGAPNNWERISLSRFFFCCLS